MDSLDLEYEAILREVDAGTFIEHGDPSRPGPYPHSGAARKMAPYERVWARANKAGRISRDEYDEAVEGAYKKALRLWDDAVAGLRADWERNEAEEGRGYMSRAGYVRSGAYDVDEDGNPVDREGNPYEGDRLGRYEFPSDVWEYHETLGSPLSSQVGNYESLYNELKRQDHPDTGEPLSPKKLKSLGIPRPREFERLWSRIKR